MRQFAAGPALVVLDEAMVRKTGATILAHKNARDKIADMARGLSAGDVVKVGKTVELVPSK